MPIQRSNIELLNLSKIFIFLALWGTTQVFAETVSLKASTSTTSTGVQRGKWIPSAMASSDWKRVSATKIPGKQTSWFRTDQTSTRTRTGWSKVEIHYVPWDPPDLTPEEKRIYQMAVAQGSYNRYIDQNAIDIVLFNEHGHFPREFFDSPTRKWVRKKIQVGYDYVWNGTSWRWEPEMYGQYDLYVYETRDISTSPGLELQILLDRTVDPDKISVSYNSGHLIFKDSNGMIFSYHPTLTEVRKNELVFAVPIDPNQGQILEYPELTYHIVEK